MLIVGIAGRTCSGKSTVVKKIIDVFHDTLKPSHLKVIEPSKRHTDIVIPGGGENEGGKEVLISIIKKHLSKIKPKIYA